LLTILAYALMLVFGIIAAMSLTGTPIANITCTGLLLFLPRLLITLRQETKRRVIIQPQQKQVLITTLAKRYIKPRLLSSPLWHLKAWWYSS
jgi:hypothetical protein